MVATNKIERLPREKARGIWAKITLHDWLSILREFHPENKWHIRGDEIVGCCLYHNEQNPSFHVAPQKGFAYCFGGSCREVVWDPTHFLAKVMNVGFMQVLKQLKSRFGIVLPTAYTQNVAKLEEHEHLKRAIITVMNLELCDIIANPTDAQYAYAANIVSWLQKRQIPLETVHQWPIGVLPTRERLYERLSHDIKNGETLREAAYEYLKAYLALPGSAPKSEGWLAFFYYTSPTTIGRIKLREPKDPLPGQERRFFIIDDPIDPNIGFFGLNMFAELRPHFQTLPVYVAEGDFDVLATVGHQMETGRNDVFMVGTGGSMDDDLDVLTEFGFKEIYLVQDNDEGGNGNVRTWLKQNTKVTKVFVWTDADRAAGVKDIDEAYRYYGFEPFFQRLCDPTSFMRNHEWALTQLNHELANVDPKDVRVRIDHAIELGKTLRDEAERNAFIDVACQDHGMNRDQLIKDIIVDDTERGFTQRLANLLSSEYDFIAKESDGSVTYVTVWSKRSRMLMALPLHSATCLAPILETDIGSYLEVVRNRVGEPEFLMYRPGPKGRDVPRTDLEKKDKLLRYFQDAVSNLAISLAPKTRLQEIGQGIHYLDESEDDEGTPRVYLVNGDRFFRGEIQGDDIKYTQLSSPLLGNKYLFRVAGQPWSKHLRSLADIEEGSKYDPKDIFQKIRQIIDMWRFEDQAGAVTFLAADVMYTTIAAIFELMVFTDISGGSHSGKSSLMQIMGGKEYTRYRICEATTVMDNYTAAGIRQFMSNNRLRLILDEFEDNDMGTGRVDSKTLAVRGILDLVRSGRTGAMAVRGTASGEATTATINFPMTVGGIYTMNLPQDLNRFVHIRTKYVQGLRSPILAVQRALTPEDMKNLRRAVTLCLLPRIPQVLKAYKDIREEYANNASLPEGIYTRSTENYYPAAAILKVAGQDYQKFMFDFSRTQLRGLTESGGVEQQYRKVWDAVLHTNIMLSHHSKDKSGMAPVAKIISDPDFDWVMRASDIGVYYLREQNWLVVFWQRAIHCVLHWNNEYRNAQNYHHLKVVADQDPRCVPREKITRTFLKTHVWPRTGAIKVTANDISILDLTESMANVTPEEQLVEPVDANEKARQEMLNEIASDIRAPRKGNFDNI